MGDDHLSTISETELDELIKSSVENLVPNPSESEDLFNIGRINEADFDPEEEIRLVKKLLYDNSSPRPLEELNSKNYDSFHFDVPSSLRPPAKPPNDDRIYFKPDTGLLTTKVVGDISKQYELIPRLLPTQPTLCPMIDTLLPFSSKNEDKVHLLSHRGFNAFQLIFESPMVIYGGNIPILDVLFLHFHPP
nr:hypothetical protein [Tanacetum cinerariifolium]